MSQTLFIFVSNSEFVIWILVIGYYGKAVSWWASPHCYAQSVAGGRDPPAFNLITTRSLSSCDIDITTGGQGGLIKFHQDQQSSLALPFRQSDR